MNKASNLSARLYWTAAAVAVAGLLVAQQFPMHRGDPNRSGLPTVDSGDFEDQNWIGRSVLRWWDPILADLVDLDNDEVTGIGATVPNGVWNAPAADARTLAFFYVQDNVGDPPYRFSTTVLARSFDDPVNPISGGLNRYDWDFDSVAGLEYRLSVNIPLGPTGTPSGTLFPQQYYVYEITGVQGGPIVEIVDTFRFGGGLHELNDGDPLVATGGTVSLRLYNTTPRAADGSPLDPFALPGQELVYADLAVLTSEIAGVGSYIASPVVNELQVGTPDFPWRVLASRNESVLVGNLNRAYDLGITSSFAYDGEEVDPGEPSRRNLVWSWPVRRPFVPSTAELERFSEDKAEWVSQEINAPGTTRGDKTITVDNLSGSTRISGFNFLPDTALAGIYGSNYLASPALTGASDSAVVYEPELPNGNYFIEIWLPEEDTGDALAQGAQYTLSLGGTPVDSFTLDQAANSNGTTGNGGWVRLDGQFEEGYEVEAGIGLRLLLTNASANPNDAGRQIYADAIRFVAADGADLSVESTPVMTTARVRTTEGGSPTQRDVAIVAMENGTIYCIDAEGDSNTGEPPQVYWTYPTERPGPAFADDPNHVVDEDGLNGIAEMPYEFDLSSATVAEVNGEDVLFIGSTNGRVYAIEMAGRGDGSTRRLWTFPDDYNPTQPEAAISPSALGPITGSVAFNDGPLGPTLYVPTPQGRLYALDAAGDPLSKTTNVRWAYPPVSSNPIGPIIMTPVVFDGAVFFGANEEQTTSTGRLFKVDEATGTGQILLSAGAFASFNTSGGLAVPGDIITTGTDPNTDSLFFIDMIGRLVRIDTDGNVLWESSEVATGTASGLGLTFMDVLDNTQSGTLELQVPIVIVPSVDGRLTGLYADGSQNSRGTRRAWGYTLEDGDLTAGVAFGGLQPGEERSWMYAAGEDGFLYAFNDLPGIDPGDQVITPGEVPGFEQIVENDPDFEEFGDITVNANVTLITPERFKDLRELQQQGALTYDEITDATTNFDVTRDSFEFGETMYMVVWGMPDLSGNPRFGGYRLQVSILGPARSSNTARPVTRLDPGGTPPPSGQEMVSLVELPMLPVGGTPTAAGYNRVQIRAVAQAEGNSESAEVNFPIFVANPIALRMLGGSEIGVTLDPRLQPFGDNRFYTTPPTHNPGNPEDPYDPNFTEFFPASEFGPTLDDLGLFVNHGQSGRNQVQVIDRSLLTLVFGENRGLQNLRVAPGDLQWQWPAGASLPANPDPSADIGIINPLDPSIYPGFEDWPLQVPNVSLDYPDVDRDRMLFTKELFGQTQNPVYGPISLNPPTIDEATLATYLTDPTAYEAPLDRQLNPTLFDVTVNVPRFQPPNANSLAGNPGYFGSQVVYVDRDEPGRSLDGTEPGRIFDLGLSVTPAPQLEVGTPTVDLGSLPSGAGLNGGPSFAPLTISELFTNPSASLVSPWSDEFTEGDDELFQPFEVINNGNVNALNVRLAKQFVADSGGSAVSWPARLFGSGLDPLAWLDANRHLHSSLDPRFSATFLAGIDPLGRNIIQKARPGDVAPTTLDVNPSRRPNPNLNIGGFQFLLDPTIFEPGRPEVGVSVPLGTPSGIFDQGTQDIYVFDDNLGNGSQALGLGEPYDQFDLRFTVRETRLTSSGQAKTSPMADRLVGGTFQWGSRDPAAARDAEGNLFVAFSSNRLTDANEPGWDARDKVPGDAGSDDDWRIYVSTLVSDLALAGDTFVNPNRIPLGDLNVWETAGDRWFQRTAGPIPAAADSAPETLFTLNPGESVVPGSVEFSSPSFPSGGFFNQLQEPGDAGRDEDGNVRYMAYVGQARVQDASGSVRRIEQVFVTELEMANDGSVTELNTVAIPFDRESRKSQPSLVQSTDGAGNTRSTTVFYTLNSGGRGQVVWNFYPDSSDPRNDWRDTRQLGLSSAFESVASPSATLRRYANEDNAHVDLVFTGKLRGRSNSEVFLAQLNVGDDGWPRGRRYFSPRVEALENDEIDNVFRARGAEWSMTRADFPNGLGDDEVYDASDRFVDVYRLDGGNLVSILDHTTRSFNRDTGVVSYDTDLGGKAYVNTRDGSVRLPNALIRRSSQLFVRYTPGLLRISSGEGANYRSVDSLYDDRFVGVFEAPFTPLFGNLAYWYDGSNVPLNPADNDPVRWDRTVVASTRTSSELSQTRPFLSSYRFGLQLPAAVATDANSGQPIDFQVTNWGSVPAEARYYQIDPVNGRIYLMADAEGASIEVSYLGVDLAGTSTFSVSQGGVVDRVPEYEEQAVPIEFVGNEGGLEMALDPLNQIFNSVTNRRPATIWMFWSSTRDGAEDVYFQTIAPRFSSLTPTP